MRNEDAFSNCHPAVNFIFFLGAIVFGVTPQHPAFFVVDVFFGIVYYLLLHGRKGWRMIVGLIPTILLIKEAIQWHISKSKI